MALEDLNAVLNLVECDGGDDGGLGNAACPFDWDRIVTAEFSKPNFVYDDAPTFEYINEQIQLGNLKIVSGYDTFTQTTPDATIATADGSGYQQVNGEMPTSFTGTLSVGVERWKALRTMNGKDNWRVAFYDAAGNKIQTTNAAGQTKGFLLKMLYTGMYKGKEGNNPATQTQMLQLTSIREMENQSYITANNIDFDPSTDLQDWNPVNITVQPLAVSATKLLITAKLIDGSHALTGTTVSDWRIQKNVAGTITTVVPSAISYTSDPGYIAFTIAAAVAGTYTVETWDDTLDVNVINLLNTLYKGAPATVVVT